MKVICVDNFDRPGYAAVVIEENLTKGNAIRLADHLNDMEEEVTPNYYMVVEDDWQQEF